MADAIGEQPIQLRVGGRTDTGGRPDNEDAILVADLPPFGSGPGAGEAGVLLAVADGMGGHEHGEVASRIAIETITTAFQQDPGADVALLLKQAFRRANEAIYQGGRANGEDRLMGTTLVVAATRGKYATIASIGDSRAYLVRADRLTQITQDHSYVAEQVAQGLMTADQARESPRRNMLTHALGHRPRLDPKIPGIFELTLLPEDRLLLVTDGFYEVVTDEEWMSTAVTAEPDAAAERLIALAKERGTTDNVSLVIAEVLPTREPLTLEPVGAGARGGLGAYLIPAIIAIVLIVLIAVAILALTRF